MKKFVAAVAMAAMALAIVAGPAAAHPGHSTAVGVYTGTALVGTSFINPVDDADDCVDGNVTGTGLFFPNTTGHLDGVFSLVVSVTSTAGPAALAVCGKLGPALGIGASCGISNGYDGIGTLNGVSQLILSGVQWPTSAGGTIPSIGHFQNRNDATDKGSLVSVSQAQGGQACASTGATSFTVVGASALL